MNKKGLRKLIAVVGISASSLFAPANSQDLTYNKFRPYASGDSVVMVHKETVKENQNLGKLLFNNGAVETTVAFPETTKIYVDRFSPINRDSKKEKKEWYNETVIIPGITAKRIGFSALGLTISGAISKYLDDKDSKKEKKGYTITLPEAPAVIDWETQGGPAGGSRQ